MKLAISWCSLPFLNIFISFILTNFVGADVKELAYLRALDDSISYRIVFKPYDEFPEHLLKTDLPVSGSGNEIHRTSDESTTDSFGGKAKENERKQRKGSVGSISSTQIVRIMSADSEEYQCVLPALAASSKKRIESYDGPSPPELLQSIYMEQICSYRIEPYWSYELCHGRYVLQYHEDKETKQRTEYFLGNYAVKQAEIESKSFDHLNPPTRKVSDDRLAYFPVTYTHGTACDVTGKPRQTTVMYVCDEEARQNIYSINEVSSCQYEIIVLSSEICAHPSFQRPAANEYEVRCYPTMPSINEEDEVADSSDDPKPSALRALEEEQRNEYYNEFGLYKTSSPVESAKKVFSKILKMDEDVLEEGFNQLNAILEAIKKSTGAAQQPSESGSEDGVESIEAKSPQSLLQKMDESQHLVDRFWRGEVCLQGGTGWWKHEVCLGRTVSQYHDAAGKPRQTILLGKFDESVHKAWSIEHHGKAVERKADGTVIQVTHMYTQGDICPETGAHRDCQVRIKCRSDITAKKVFIYMLEPNTCSYVVVLESALFCPKLQFVDEHGLLPATTTDEQQSLDGSSLDVREGGAEGVSKTLKRKFGSTTVEFDLLNQEDILRVVKSLLEGAENNGDQQILITAAKMKIEKQQSDEESGKEEKSSTEAEGMTTASHREHDEQQSAAKETATGTDERSGSGQTKIKGKGSDRDELIGKKEEGEEVELERDENESVTVPEEASQNADKGHRAGKEEF